MLKLSIIIPALNEAEYIEKTLTSILDNRCYESKPEIILVDSGSTDNTISIAKLHVDQVIELSPKSSGKSEVLNTGAEASGGEVLLFLDADTILPKDYDKDIETALSDKTIIGGAFEFTLNGKEFGLRVVELINRIRYRIRHSFYGDQGVFVTRDIFFKAGLFPKRRLFETSELCKMLRRYGKLKLIKKRILTSPRRFLDGGIYSVLLNDTKLWFLNNRGLIPDDKKADIYWEENERRGEQRP
ncbi:MAG: glycosyltransferase family 2 protein [Candidatus Dadabacteria bacterium]|nr:glycosyltransferase family 2 protein [Candidatus Dadabacteria bacterium]NIS08487.1 glycosyltransferase family 2 protein [Candidatus Dadabacteria bacterium]NIV41628.1 glycosyltransferase [Candidatus Dadabacteria bacterium]NIY21975.1 glycosyltransferase [Candidatus Dadabacteria bacterium]